MKLDSLHTFHSHIQDGLEPEGIKARLYYEFSGKWHDLVSNGIVDPSTTSSLERAKKESVAHHATNSLDAWFYFPPRECAVQLEFPKSPRLETRLRYRDRLTKIEESASNAYQVAHNPLTQLLSKDAFRIKLSTVISDVNKRQSISAETQESGTPRSLAVMAFDIDHFKQVNDTWGHLYGDQVLKSLARRLEQCAETIRSDGVGNPSVYLGHPSGEEFLALIQANVSRDQFVEWANAFRKEIADKGLPSDSEWEWLSSSGSIGVLTLPPLSDRTTTVSIGVALHSSSASFDSGVDQVSSLLDRADTALYRAKAGGRNQAIFYDEILSSCGRVIEQDKSTGVVALDIGSNVGVAIGQEFKLFSPTFSGNTKFMINDGRTKRTLGFYPRVELARIVVFNTQPEISFAFIASPTETPIQIDPGSNLEAIPAGSIGHLLPSSSKYFPTTSEGIERGINNDPHEFVKKTVAQGGSPFAIVVRFTREAEYLRKHGSVALNMALAQLYRGAQLEFHAAKVIEQLDRGSICIAGEKAAYKESIVTEFVQSMATELPELGVFAGIFCDADREASKWDGQNTLDSVNAVEFARFAAADAGRSPDARTRHFSYTECVNVLKSLRDSGSFDVAYADFERLRRLGVESAGILNLGGLITGSLGNRQQSFELYGLAMAKNPNDLIIKGNYGVGAYRLGDIESALKILNSLPLEDIGKLREQHEYAYFLYAVMLAQARNLASSYFDANRFNLIAPIALGLTRTDSHEFKIINDALNKP